MVKEKEEEISTAAKGIKLDANRSRFAHKQAQKEQFETQADAVIDAATDRKQRGMQLSKQFWDLLNSSTLEKNKGPLEKSLEKEILNNLLQFAQEVNNDENEPEGMGSVAISALFIRAIFQLRNVNNDLSYRVHELEKIIESGK